MDLTEMHRERDGRLEIDQFSRRLVPRWKLVRVDGLYYGRKAMARWILDRGGTAPASRRLLTPLEMSKATNREPFRIFGKAPVRPLNRAAALSGR